MANVFKPKRSSTASSVPTTANLEDGELAVNSADQKIYLRDGASIVEVGNVAAGGGGISNVVEDTTPQLGGNLDLNSNNITGTGNVNITGNVTLTGTVDGRDVATDGTKLDGIEASADVTDATNVAAAGAVMESDTSTANMSFVVDEDNMVSNSATKVPTQQSVKAYVDANAGGGGGTALRYLHVDGTGTQNLSTTAITLDFDTTIATSDAGDFTVGAGGEITVINAGTYFIEYSATGDQTSGSNRVIVSAQLEVNGTVVTGSQADVYSRNTADGDFSAVGSSVVVLSANDVVRVRAFSDSNTIIATIDNTISGLSMFTLSGSGPQGATGATGPQGPTDVPQNAQTSAYTLVASDNGKHVSITTGGVTVPSGVFSAGNIVTIYNNSASNQTITQGASVTLREAGTANTGNRTLGQRGLATILCVASNEFVITGTIT